LKIALISDLHLEFSDILPYELGIPDDVDVILCPGDIHPRAHMRDFFLRELEVIAPVVYIPGNHEYYKNDCDDPTTVYKVVGDKKIAAATLWTEMDEYSFQIYSRALNDCWYIEGWTYNRYLAVHLEQKKFIFDAIHKEKVDIVVTHHGPTYQSVTEQYKGDPLNFCFVNPFEEDLADIEHPVLWVHGHIHQDVDYMANNVHVLTHPRGYPHESNIVLYQARIIVI
jgi:Icc-related predicted phosphoesterase